MEQLREYERQKNIDFLAWKSLPRTTGFWVWYGTTIYLWNFKSMNLDSAAIKGLLAGLIIWILFRTLLGFIGAEIIHYNMWGLLGCGCFARLFVTELFQYIAIIILGIWAYKVDSLNFSEMFLSVFIGSINWFLISFSDIRFRDMFP